MDHVVVRRVPLSVGRPGSCEGDHKEEAGDVALGEAARREGPEGRESRPGDVRKQSPTEDKA